MISSVPPPIGPGGRRARPARCRPRPCRRRRRGSAGSVHDVERRALGGELGHRHLAAWRPGPRRSAQRRVGDARPASIVVRHLGELVADRLVCRSAGRTPCARARTAASARSDLHRPDRAERHQQPLPLEVGHDQVEAAVLVAEQVLLGHEDVVEARSARCRRRASRSSRSRGTATPRPRSMIRNEMPWWPPSGVVLHRGDEEVGAHAVGDEHLRAVDHVAAVDPPRVRADAGDVRAGVGLGDRQRSDLLAADARARGSAASAPRCRTSRSAAWRCRCARRSRPRARPIRSGRAPR